MAHNMKNTGFISVLLLALILPPALRAQEDQRTFSSPTEALAAFTQAVNAGDREALHKLFGPHLADIENADQVQATNELSSFAAALNATNRLVHETETRCIIEVGDDHWPFAIPIVQEGGKWLFDTDAGEDELLNRRIGRNELATLDVVRAYVGAQREYASQDRDGSQVLQYAQRLASSPGKKDGLYWSPDLDGDISPLGPLVAVAQSHGYNLEGQTNSAATAPVPFHGYLFKIIKRQGKHAPGGKYSYVINGRMIAGFALVAWPADYGKTGIMTFIVNQQGRVYEKDLGDKTDKQAPALDTYDPDSTWQLSPD